MKSSYCFLLGLLMVCLSGCQSHEKGPVSGRVETIERQVESFKRVIVKSGSAKIYVKQADVESLKIEAEESIIAAFNIRLENETLEIEQKISSGLYPSKPINFYVTTRNIDSVSIFGSGELHSQGNLKVDKLKVNISGSGLANLEVTGNELFIKILGSGEATVKGTIDSQKIAINGNATYNAPDLISKEAYISMNGSGKAYVNVQDSLNIKIFGSGILKYIGKPELQQSISGSGSIEAVNAKETKK